MKRLGIAVIIGLIGYVVLATETSTANSEPYVLHADSSWFNAPILYKVLSLTPETKLINEQYLWKINNTLNK